MKKAQLSQEFIILTGSMLFLFTIFFLIINQRIVEYHEAKDIQALEEVGEVLETELKLALQVKEGYSRRFSIPPLIRGRQYDIGVLAGIDATSLNITFTNFTLPFEKVINVPHDIVVKDVSVGYNCITKVNKTSITLDSC